MSNPDGTLTETSHAQTNPTLKHAYRQRFRWLRNVVALLSLVGICAFEISGPVFQRISIEKIKKFARLLEKDARLTPSDVESQLTGWTFQSENSHQRMRMLVYRWPSLIASQKLRVIVSRHGHILYIDREQDESEDFMQPFITWNQEGIRVHDRDSSSRNASQSDPTNPIDAARKYYSLERTPVHPGIVIFPVVDGWDGVIPAGAAISMTALHSIIGSDRRRIAVDPAQVRSVLVEARSWSGGDRLGTQRTQLILAELGLQHCVVPRLVIEGGTQRLNVELHSSSGAITETIEHDVTEIEINLWPGILALDVLNYLKEPLNPQERLRIAAPQFATVAEAERFVRDAARGLPVSLAVSEQSFGMQPAIAFHKEILLRNPNWIAGWDLVLGLWSRFLVPHPKPTSASLRECITVTRYLTNGAGSEPRFFNLLGMAQKLRSDVSFHSELVGLAIEMGNEPLVEEMLVLWEQEDRRYPSRVERAKRWMDWGTMLLSISPEDANHSGNVNVGFRRALDRAHNELIEALKSNHQGWSAHAEFIRHCHLVAGINGEQDALLLATEHFERAIQILPDSPLAWEYQFKFLMSRQATEDVSAQLYRYAEQCVKSGAWDRGIPQKVLPIFDAIVFPKWNVTGDLRGMRSDRYWALVNDFWRAAQRQTEPKSFPTAIGFFAYQAAMTDHFVEAAGAFEMLDQLELAEAAKSQPKSGGEPTAIQQCFKSQSRYIDLRDRVWGATRRDVTGQLCAIRVALANAQVALADKLLTAVEVTDAKELDEANRLRAAVELARRLDREGLVELTAGECLQLFASVQGTQGAGLSHDSNWKAVDDQLIMTNLQESTSWHRRVVSVFFPLGLTRCTVRGEIQCTGRFENLTLLSNPIDGSKSIKLQYDKAQGVARLIREPIFNECADLPAFPLEFAVSYAPKSHVFSPYSPIEWELQMQRPTPIRLGFELTVSSADECQFSIRKLTLERCDVD